MLSTSQDNEAPVQHQSLIFLQNIALKNEPIVRGPTKQDYLTHEAGINASRTIGYFLWAVVATIFRARNQPSAIIPQTSDIKY